MSNNIGLVLLKALVGLLIVVGGFGLAVLNWGVARIPVWVLLLLTLAGILVTLRLNESNIQPAILVTATFTAIVYVALWVKIIQENHPHKRS